MMDNRMEDIAKMIIEQQYSSFFLSWQKLWGTKRKSLQPTEEN